MGGITADHPENWTIAQLRNPAQKIANTIKDL